MPYLVSPATEPEISHIITIMFCAYAGRNEYINVVFPEGLTPGGHALTVQRLLFIQSVAPCVWWNKVVDEATGELLGGAMWNLCVREKPPAYEMDGPEGTWDTEEDKRYAQALQRSFVEDEGQIWDRERLPILGLAIMAVEPGHQRKGAGTALLRDGLRIADKMNAATILVSNEAGLRLFEKNGFMTESERDLSVPEEFGPRPKVRIWTMIRKRREA